MTSDEEAGIRAAARRYVQEEAPTPPTAVLEQVARIVLEVRTSSQSAVIVDQTAGTPGRPAAA
jgi:hypothetical protein